MLDNADDKKIYSRARTHAFSCVILPQAESTDQIQDRSIYRCFIIPLRVGQSENVNILDLTNFLKLAISSREIDNLTMIEIT